jgi:hypothetical protein
MRGRVAVVHSRLCRAPLFQEVRVRSVERAVCPVCVGRLWTASLGLHADATIFSNRLTTIAMSEVGPL